MVEVHVETHSHSHYGKREVGVFSLNQISREDRGSETETEREKLNLTHHHTVHQE